MSINDTIPVTCPGCKFEFKVFSSSAGKRIRCPKCKAAFFVETPAASNLNLSPAVDPPKRSAMEWVYMRWVALALAAYAGYAGYRQLVPRAAMDPRSLDQVLADAQPTRQYLMEEEYERPKLEAELQELKSKTAPNFESIVYIEGRLRRMDENKQYIDPTGEILAESRWDTAEREQKERDVIDKARQEHAERMRLRNP